VTKKLQITALLIVGLLMLALALTSLAQTPAPTETPTPEPTEAVIETEEADEAEEEEDVSLPIITVAPTEVVTETEETELEADVDEEEEDAEEAEEAIEPADALDEAQVELTLYANRGLVQEVLTLELMEGENEVRHPGVASAIDPTSVHLRLLDDPEGVRVLEQFYHFDLMDTPTLLTKYVGEEIGVRAESGEFYTGTLLAAENDLILATEEGFQIIRSGSVQEFALPMLEEELVTQPTLVWLLGADEEGPQQVRLTYLTDDMGWHADYVLTLSEEDESALTAWVTLRNHSGASYADARLKLIAGDVAEVRQPEIMMRQVQVEAAMADAGVEERSFFEYHLYEVQRLVTVPDRRAKQIEFASAPAITPTRTYLFAAAPPIIPRPGAAQTDPRIGLDQDTPVQVRLEMTNSVESGLGLPLPAGVVRVYQAESGQAPELVGEDRIGHTARGEELSLRLGNAFDVIGERTQVDFEQLEERRIQETIQITLRNRKDEAITVRVNERLFRALDATILDASEEYTMIDANTAQFLMPVEVDAEAVLTYTVEYVW
jgi:hypothetical protein